MRAQVAGSVLSQEILKFAYHIEATGQGGDGALSDVANVGAHLKDQYKLLIFLRHRGCSQQG